MIWSDKDLKVVADRAVDTWLSMPAPRPSREEYLVKVACEWLLDVLKNDSIQAFELPEGTKMYVILLPEEQP